ncbi:MAG TPA: PEP-utilizing enzyme [bacterium]|nr:PEP-utilizing enzyme [bacterium]
MQELKFEAPGGGVWEQDSTHFPRPLTRFAQEAFPAGFKKGFSMGTSGYGLLLDHLVPGFVNGFLYMKPRIVGAPENAKGGPPPKPVFKLLCLLHPEVRRRVKRAKTVMQEKPWREHLRNWDEELKPKSTQNQLRLQSVGLSGLSDEQLMAHFAECWENSKAMAFQHHIYTISCGMPVGDFMACVQEWTQLPPSEISQALRGSTPISSGVTEEYLAALKSIEKDKEAQRILKSQSRPAEILAQLRALPGETGKAVSTYLDLVSYRVIGGYDVTCPTAIETPEILVKSLQETHSPEEAAKAEQKVRAQIAKIRQAVPEEKRAAFDEILGEARLVNRLRDERSYWSDLWSTGITRHVLLEIGRRLAAKGSIRQADHILHASYGETQALFTGKGSGPVPGAEELEKRAHYHATVSTEIVPPFLGGKPSPPPPVEWYPEEARRTMKAMDAFLSHLFGAGTKANEAKVVHGISVSSGVYEGKARVVSNIDELNQIQKGEVLVTGSTSTAFNYVLPLVGGIVTDRGGLMSHAAIVAREYGLPGVVGCRDAVKTIPNGAKVRVDADKGEVTILS